MAGLSRHVLNGNVQSKKGSVSMFRRPIESIFQFVIHGPSLDHTPVLGGGEHVRLTALPKQTGLVFDLHALGTYTYVVPE